MSVYVYMYVCVCVSMSTHSYRKRTTVGEKPSWSGALLLPDDRRGQGGGLQLHVSYVDTTPSNGVWAHQTRVCR